MRNILCIYRRDLASYFTSPIGYIFIIVFITISVGLYITSFFSFPVADMRPYFENLPLILCVFIPAITMRLWAEERKENTWEMLLTFPMKASELVLGKFLSALTVFAISLAMTFTVPVMLKNLGNPDMGAIIGGYFGTLLLASCFLALGIFFSGFCKDQIVAFVITLLTCLLLFLLGTSFIASYIDDKLPGLGSLFSNLLGVFKHFGSFTKGVIDLADVIFFLVWTVLFLVLNIMYIDQRNRPGAKMMFTVAVAVCVAIGLMFNFLMVGTSLKRFDLTEDKIYTVSESSAKILRQVEVPVQVNVYISPQESMPTAMKDLEQNIKDKLEELKIAAGGKLNYKTIYLDVSNLFSDQDEMFAQEKKKNETEEETVERRLLDKGVKPFNVRAISQDEVTNKLVYSSIGVAYKDKPEEIIPQIVPENIQELEYRIVSTVYKLTRTKAPIVALVAPKEAINIDPQMRQMLQQMGQQIPQSEDPYVYLEEILRQEKYDVRRVDMTKESPLPEEYDTLVVVNPRSFNDRQRWEINRALRSGKSVVLAVQTYEWDYRATPRGNTVSKREEKPEINPLLENYGLKVSEDILMDENSVTLNVQGGGDLMSQLVGQPFRLPMHILVTHESMDQETSITNRLSAVFYLWGTHLELNEQKLKELGLTYKPLMFTSEKAWTVPGSEKLSAKSFEPPALTARKKYPLMVMVEGQFPDAFAGKERPAWPKPQPRPGEPVPPDDSETEPPAGNIEPKPSKMILLGCSEMFRKNFLQAGNLDLFLNCVDAVSLTEDLVNVRGRKPIDRTIEKPTDSQKMLWRTVNYTLSNAIVIAVGLAVYFIRRRSRLAYTMAQITSAETNR
ncbi:MAG TPA: Gldg family protein [Candidatus Hydrogenedens sp.]|nr:Gldg family protein [Candidatus Hydrogenedens sp.]